MKTITDFLIDISDNMKDRMSIAQKILSDEIIPSFDFSEPFGMRTFLSIARSPIVINSIDLGVNSKNDFLERVKKLPLPNGGSPIAYTIQKSIDSLSKSEVPVKRIVLITAGIDTEGKSYEYEAEKGNKEENIQVNILGIGLGGPEEKTASKAATLSNGCFCNIPLDATSSQIKEIILPLLSKLKEKDNQPKITVQPPKEDENPAASSQPREEKEEKAENQKEKVTVKPKTEIIAEIPQTDITPFIKSFEDQNNSIAELLKKNTEDFQKLVKEEQNARKEIERLKALSGNSEAENERLKKELQETVAEMEKLRQQEKDVVIFEDEEYKRSVSRKSEKLLFEHLEKKYPKRVKWINQESKKDVGYDFEVIHFDSNSIEYYIACKGIAGDSKTFFLNKKEWEMCLKDNLHYQVYLILNIEDKPKIVIIDNLMGRILDGNVVPYAPANKKVKAGQVMFTLVS
jgi:hypothetical protein